jgi:ParB-like chromosome segregation protein Spo0J
MAEKATAKAPLAKKKPIKKAVKAAAVKPKKKLRRITSLETDGIKSLLGTVERADMKSIKVHPRNPREGDIDSIRESLEENGQYRRLVVQESTRFILAGNHTYLAARQAGWKFIDIEVVDVDDDEAETILLADNATGQRGGFNEQILADILRKRKSVRGTGYKPEEVEDILSRTKARTEEAIQSLEERSAAEEEAIEAAKEGARFERVPLGEEALIEDDDDFDDEDDEDEDEEPKADGRLEKASGDLDGAFTLKNDMTFSKDQSVGPWEIPRVRLDMLMTWDDLPEKLLAWAGSATKDWPDEDVWWLYNFGSDSTSGMNDVSKLILSFYAHDKYFENWWFYPDKYVAKLLNTGIKYAVMPDFSMHTPGFESRVLSMWSLYRTRWLSRYMQEAGLKIAPNVTWATADEDFLVNHTLKTMPKNIPLLSLQVQTIDAKHPLYEDNLRQTQLVLDTIKPKDLLLYHGILGERLFRDGTIKFDGRIKYVMSRQEALSKQAKGRQKKTTL